MRRALSEERSMQMLAGRGALPLVALLLLPTLGLAQNPVRKPRESKDQPHWAFQPVKKPNVPAVNDKDWVRNPIDAFVLSQLEARKLKPAVPAERRALLRR